MSGHSKWHSIKHKKAAADAKRGKVFTRIIRELTIAARLGGGDASSNPRLRTAIAGAKEVNMPLKNIESAIKKGSGELEGASYEEVMYEGYGPGGVAMLVEATTDNRNRTTAEIRHIFTKYHGSMGAPGSVAYQFQHVGLIAVSAAGQTEDGVMEAAVEAGADDVRAEGEVFLITTQAASLHEVREALESAGLRIESAELGYVPSLTKALEGKEAEQCLKLVSMLEDNDDVKSVSANFDISDELLEQYQS